MASPSEQPWSDHEKNYLLAEIIKSSHPQPAVLYDVIARFNIQPRWDDIPLPPGRSVNSCRAAYEGLRRSARPFMPTMGPQTPTPMSAPLPALKRPYYEAPYSAGPSGREIRPKPSASGTPIPRPSPSEPPPKRKRGRPTKAEALAKAEAAATAESISSIAPRAPPVSLGPISTPARDLKPTAPTTSGMPIAAMLTPVQGSQQSASQSSSSSGKRRRARSTKSEPDDGMTAIASAPGPEYESPYARMARRSGSRGGDDIEGQDIRPPEDTGEPEDTPVRSVGPLQYQETRQPSPQRPAASARPPSAERPTPRSSPPRRL